MPVEPELYRAVFLGNRPYGSGYWGAEYDFTGACPGCLAGAQRTGPALLDPRELRGRKYIETAEHDWIVSTELRQQIEKAALTGIHFGPVMFSRPSRIKESDVGECIVSSVLPRLSAKSRVIRDHVCPACHRGCYSDLIGGGTVLAFECTSLDSVADFNLTWEQFGGTIKRHPLSRSFMPLPLLIVSGRVKALFKACRVSPVKFESVVIGNTLREVVTD